MQEVGDEHSFRQLCDQLGSGWTGVLSTHFQSPHTIRVGWLSPHRLTDVEEVIGLPAALSPVKVDDKGTTITRAGRGALAVTCTTDDGVEVRAVADRLGSSAETATRARLTVEEQLGGQVDREVPAGPRTANERGMRTSHVLTALAACTAGVTTAATLRRHAGNRPPVIPTVATTNLSSSASNPDRDAVVLPFARPITPGPAPAQPASPARCRESCGRTKAGVPCGARTTTGGRRRHHPMAA